MLESNTEAKQATGTGSKLGPGWGRERGRGATLPSGLTTTALGGSASPRQERPLWTLPTAQGTRDGVPRVAQGWPGGNGSQGPAPSPSSPSHSIKHTTDAHLGVYGCGEPETQILCGTLQHLSRRRGSKRAVRGRSGDPGGAFLGQQSVEREGRPGRAPLAQPGGTTAATGPHDEDKNKKEKMQREIL